MRSGDLRHKITIQERTATADGMGGETLVWSDLYPCRASIWPISAKESIDADKLELKVDHRIRIRHPRMMNITADMRIKWLDHITNENKYFNIVSIRNPDKRNKMLEFLAWEKV
jgi:SPP1 family predicted phage head-tail adaptor